MVFACRIEGCIRRNSPFSSLRKLGEHLRGVHHSPSNIEELYADFDFRRCTICNGIFVGHNGLRVHHASFHSRHERGPPDQDHNSVESSVSSRTASNYQREDDLPEAEQQNSPVVGSAPLDLPMEQRAAVLAQPSSTNMGKCRAVSRIRRSLLFGFRNLFQKLTRALIDRIRTGIAEGSDVNAFYSLPLLISDVTGDREERRKKQTLARLVAEDDIFGACALECARIGAKFASDHRNPDPRRFQRRKVVDLVEAGLPGKAVQCLSSFQTATIADLDDDLRRELQILHPEDNGLGLPVPALQPELPPMITQAELLEALDKAPRLSASAVSGWTYDLIRELLKGADNAVIQTAVDLLNELLQGNASHPQAWLRSRLVPLQKSTGGVRPIAIGEAWPRLLGRIVAARYTPRVRQFLSPMQLGIGVSGGVEIAAHLVQTASLAVKQDPDVVIQSVDFANAFNTIDRTCILRMLDQHFPDLSRFFRWSYGHRTPLIMGDEVACFASSGVRQGDPLGPAFFSLGLHHVLTQAADAHPEVTIVAFLDDVYLIGARAKVADAFTSLKELASQVHLRVKHSKSILLDSALIADTGGTLALSTAVGHPAFVEQHMHEVLASKSDLVDQIITYDARHALAMLRASIAARPMYWARTVTPGIADEAFASFDNKIDWALTRLIGATRTDLCGAGSLLRHLPVNMGGLSMRKFQLIRRQCWAASYGAALPYIQRHLRRFPNVADGLLEELRQIVPAFALEAPRPFAQETNVVESADVNQVVASFSFPKQRQLMKEVDEEVMENVLSTYTGSPVIQSWIRSSTCVESGAWIVNAGLRSHPRSFTDSLFRTALQLRLLQPAVLVQPNQAIRCVCEHFTSMCAVEAMVHSLGCYKLSELRTARHHSIRDTLASFLRSMRLGAHIHTEVELPRPGDRRTNERLKSDVRWLQGNEVLHFDVSVASPASLRAIEKNSDKEVGVAAIEVERMKRRQYRVALESAALSPDCMKPMVFETSGRKGSEMSGIENWLRSKLLQRTTDDVELQQKLTRLFNMCVTNIWKHNARMIQVVVRADGLIRQQQI